MPTHTHKASIKVNYNIDLVKIYYKIKIDIKKIYFKIKINKKIYYECNILIK